jgi:hypothetical protein
LGLLSVASREKVLNSAEFQRKSKISNIMEVKTALSTYSFRQYKTLGNCIEDLTLNGIPELNMGEIRRKFLPTNLNA